MAILEAFEDTKDQDQSRSPPASADASSSTTPRPPADLPESDRRDNDGGNNEKTELELETTAVRFSPEEEASLLAESDELKRQGNLSFGDHDYDNARSKYMQALSICPKYLDNPRSILWSNVSACNARQQKWQDTVDACTHALKLQPNYMKPLLRRAHANEQIASWSSLQQAGDDYKLAHELAPTNETRLALQRLAPKIADAQKRETAEMMSKLKELGNGILRPFGLNTDMFKMQPDGKGGYSMSFSKN
ncbi:hypothetical protein V1509DRAFT_629360 [Lipomyces kononenkoae]